ncbi:hypothetical protein [Nonomuraea angiospora]|uniref:hypothetical protein n=1 Tax=Nonomuraea angiospora TaxID=46172 RepID=UPI0029B6DCEF|nr:hypothetical protein [Nonomuraea angiospora]MDX3102899.1 hypothetical protein [Nonomuraea angiospora]
MLRLLMTLLTVTLLAGGGNLLVRQLTFDDFAARAVWTWRTSGAAEIWRDGFVPTEGLSKMPQDVEERIQRDEEWGFAVAGSLPATPSGARIRWDDGSTMRVPVISARRALVALSPYEEEASPQDDRAYKMTAATFTTMRVRTLRGMATVPAWRLYFSNLPGPIDHAAVDRDAAGTVEHAVGSHLPPDVRSFEVLDERTLRVSYDYGVCSSQAKPPVRLRVDERSDVVVLGIEVQERIGSRFCAGVGRSGEGIVRLGQPLGGRVALDANSRLPICLHTSAPCRAG